jgi:hypothetical protein
MRISRGLVVGLPHRSRATDVVSRRTSSRSRSTTARAPRARRDRVPPTGKTFTLDLTAFALDRDQLGDVDALSGSSRTQCGDSEASMAHREGSTQRRL